MTLRRGRSRLALALALLSPALLAGQTPDRLFELNARGARGVVRFNHTAHEKAAPDPASPHRADPKATCAGCHHTRTETGVPQLTKCGACHFGVGHEKNPRSRAFDEVDAEAAFHQRCIGCHRSANKGPTACADCHQTRERTS